MSHILLNNGKVLAYNGNQAVIIKSNDVKGLSCAVPANIATALFKSLPPDDIKLSSSEDSLTVVCNDTKIKLVTIPATEFGFDESVLNVKGDEFLVSSEFLNALSKCLLTTDDSELTDTGGIYLIAGDTTTMFSTDRLNISKYKLDDNLVKNDLVLPTAFCQLLLSHRQHFEGCTAILNKDYLLVKSKGFNIFTHLKTPETIPKFEDVWNTYTSQETPDSIEVTDEMIDAVDRCSIILTQDKKPIELYLKDESLIFYCESSYGIMNIPVKVKTKDTAKIVVDAVYLKPFVSNVKEFVIYKDVILGHDGNFSRLTAGMSHNTK